MTTDLSVSPRNALSPRPLRGDMPRRDAPPSGPRPLRRDVAVPLARGAGEFERDVLSGLLAEKKSLPCKYFYDARGSRLFEEICATPEYYVTRTELSLLRQVCPRIAPTIGPSADVLEPGSGAGEKIRILLDALESPRSFIPIDISESAVENSARVLREQYPKLDIIPLVLDFTQPFQLPAAFSDEGVHRRVIFFPGSTISNFSPSGARSFLRTLRGVLRSSDFLLIGVDRIKDRGILERAYDDAQGVTAEFNLNLLHRISAELETNLNPQHFEHVALYNSEENRIEMYLRSQREQVLEISGHRISFARGELIHTENSYKYSVEGFLELADSAGYRVREHFSDERDLFTLYFCEVP